MVFTGVPAPQDDRDAVKLPAADPTPAPMIRQDLEAPAATMIQPVSAGADMGYAVWVAVAVFLGLAAAVAVPSAVVLALRLRGGHHSGDGRKTS